MRVAVFGGTGFVGRKVIDLLKAGSHEYLEISRTSGSEHSHAADITNLASLNGIKGNFDTVIICASKLPGQSGDPGTYTDVNVNGVTNVLSWAKARSVSRIVFCSSLSIVPDTDPNEDETNLIQLGSHYAYRISKAAGEHLVMGFCKENQIDFFVLRIASIYGSGMKNDVIQTIIDKTKTGNAFMLRNRNIEVDFVHVDDVAAVILSCITAAGSAEIVNVSSGSPIMLFELVKLINRVMGGKSIRIDVASETPVASRRHSNEKFIKLINRNPVTLEAGLKDLIHSAKP